MAFPNEYHIKFFDQTTYVSDTFLSFTEIPRKRFREWREQTQSGSVVHYKLKTMSKHFSKT